MVLIGHEANYSVENTDSRLGVRYNRKAMLDGSNQDRLQQATIAALVACQTLEGESRLNGKLRYNGQEIELSINDRILAPNSQSTREATASDFRVFCDRLFRGGQYSLSFLADDPRKLFAVSVKSSHILPLSALLKNLSS